MAEQPNYCKILDNIVTVQGVTFGVLDTPCFPCRYYGGSIEKANHKGSKVDEWHTKDNATLNFFRDKVDANLHALKLANSFIDSVAERKKRIESPSL